MAAVLEIRADGSSARRMFAELGREAERFAAGMSSTFRRANADMIRGAREAGREAARVYADAARSREQSAQAGARAEQRATQVARAEGGYRTNAYRGEAEAAKRAADDVARARETAERRATATATREANRRAHAERQANRERDQQFGGRAAAAAGAGLQFAGAAHGLIQDARGRRAASAHTMNAALYQAGAGAGDAASLRRRMYEFARANGMDSGQLAEAANAAQTEFSVLGTSRSTQAERSANVDNFLQTQLFARNTGQSGAEVARVQGMLQNSGLDAAAQRSTLLGLTGMAQRGAIELGAVSRTAMAPMQQRIAQALVNVAPGDAAGRNHATQQAVLQTFAEMEVGRGMGMTPRALGNITANMGTALGGSATQAGMLRNIRQSSLSEAQRTRLENQLFARDSHGNSVLRGEYRDTMGLAQGLTAAGINSQQAQNVFAGTGAGNAQSLQANYRRTLAAFMGEGNDNVARMMAGVGTDFTQADVQRGAGLFGGEEQTQLQRDREEHDTALVGNTSALTQLSNAFAAFSARNPLLGPAAGTASGLVGTTAATRAGAALPALVRGAATIGGGGAIGAGITGAAVLGAGAAGLGIGEVANRALDARALNGGRSREERGVQNISSVFSGQTWRDLGTAIAEAFGANPPVVRIDPSAAAQLARQAGSSGGGRPAEAGR